MKIRFIRSPAQSPDLNPMEHYWKFVDRKIKEITQVVATKEELWKRVESIVSESNKDLCRNLIATMSERVVDVLRAKGGYTRW